MQTSPAVPGRRALEFGIYRDGDNNLDSVQESVVTQARATSAADSAVEFSIDDTSEGLGAGLHSTTFRIADGTDVGTKHTAAQDMADPRTLADFVAKTLDNAEASGATQTWIDLVDHGAGDGGGLEADTYHGIMRMPDIAAAIAAGEAQHAKEHPEDANRHVDGVVANQCLMASMGFIDALSTAGVKYLAASPETMLAPGVPSNVADAIAKHTADPSAMAQNIVDTVMNTHYGTGALRYGPAAAFDVFTLDHTRVTAAEAAIKRFNDDAAASGTTAERTALRSDTRSIDGMVRFPDATDDMPWHADRPALALYGAIANDARLSSGIREDARAARDAIAALTLAHSESASFGPFDNADYSDAQGPTIHTPISPSQIDPWAPHVSETDNAFYKKVDQDKFVGVVA